MLGVKSFAKKSFRRSFPILKYQRLLFQEETKMEGSNWWQNPDLNHPPSSEERPTQKIQFGSNNYFDVFHKISIVGLYTIFLLEAVVHKLRWLLICHFPHVLDDLWPPNNGPSGDGFVSLGARAVGTNPLKNFSTYFYTTLSCSRFSSNQKS